MVYCEEYNVEEIYYFHTHLHVHTVAFPVLNMHELVTYGLRFTLFNASAVLCIYHTQLTFAEARSAGSTRICQARIVV
jgi:hypothetical protein